jgi:hypothetical protein
MSGLIDELRERNETVLDAAKELGRGLMRGNKAEFKLGYSWDNAALAAVDMFDLPKIDAFELRFYLLGFARGMHGADPGAEQDLETRIRAVSERYVIAYGDGRRAGLMEDRDRIGPAGLPGDEEIDNEAAEAPPAPPQMKECGCGAKVEGECTAAVEGYFTSLGQRSDEELRSLAEGDGCEAARVMLLKRAERSDS